jgi:hypothetical protein
LVVVEQQANGVVEYPFEAVPPTVHPYSPEGSNHLCGYQMSLTFGNIVKNIMSDWDFSGVKIDTFHGVGDCFRQVPVRIEDGKAAFIFQN